MQHAAEKFSILRGAFIMNRSEKGQHSSQQLCAEKDVTRTLIFHYHLFKNAGTSVDEILERNFGSRWEKHEFNVAPRANAEAVVKRLQESREMLALSSHTALLPAPQIDGVSIFPIIFVRHPIDRLRSAYEFERIQNADTLGSKLAKAHDFGGYLQGLLENKKHRQVRNFQTLRLAQNEPAEHGSERERALRALDTLPFVGLVEAFDRSLELLERRLIPLFPNFRVAAVHRNVAKSRHTALKQRLEAVKSDLGKDFYKELRMLNEDDIAVFRTLKKRFADLE